jgi:protein-tyrosine phosphatase
MFNNSDLSGITYGKSPYILTEFPYGSRFSEKTMRRFYQLTQNYKLIPVMPHVERYDYLMSHPDMIAQLKDLGVVIQTNISNYTAKTPFFRRRKMLKMISRGQIDLLGSDAHSFRHNTPEVFTEAMNTIAEKCGDEALADMMDYAADIFSEAF